MAVNNIIKRIQNIMRQDAGINGDAQRIEQMTWMFFLKVYDTQEETWEWKDEKYKSIIPEDLRWFPYAVEWRNLQNICLFKVKNTILRIFVKKSLQYFTSLAFVLSEVVTFLYIVSPFFPRQWWLVKCNVTYHIEDIGIFQCRICFTYCVYQDGIFL